MRRRFNVMDVVWTSKRRCVLTGVFLEQSVVHAKYLRSVMSLEDTKINIDRERRLHITQI